MASKVVVVHSGARDSYQVARALKESGRLDCLVTDLFWPSDAPWAERAAGILPSSIEQQLSARSELALEKHDVRQCLAAGALTLGLDKWKRAPQAWKRSVMRWNDAKMGKTAGKLATSHGSALLSYSYYGHSAFTHFEGERPGMLFQLHPHPASMRRILRAELEKHPDCATSLEQEWELALPEADFRRLAAETEMAGAWLAASSFTKVTLAENGIPAERIHVVPYGVNLEKFHPAAGRRVENGPLRLLFVGRINQRKGVKYLLEALKRLPAKHVELTICGRVLDDLKIFEPFRSQITIRPSVSHAELVAAYQTADLFVFPSVAEGFAHVLLESMACGLPVLSTTATAAPDLVTEGVDGFVVEPGASDALVSRVEWALSHRGELNGMREAARRKAEQFTWARFRQGVNDFVSAHCEPPAVLTAEEMEKERELEPVR
ncbi:MAG TPA: glycosyltransferase family 4 protein [Bryobacteraceae bacterium]|nr:glycosyltransferase family 4 protein [Bryobacteraceae bacterium]